MDDGPLQDSRCSCLSPRCADSPRQCRAPGGAADRAAMPPARQLPVGTQRGEHPGDGVNGAALRCSSRPGAAGSCPRPGPGRGGLKARS